MQNVISNEYWSENAIKIFKFISLKKFLHLLFNKHVIRTMTRNQEYYQIYSIKISDIINKKKKREAV